MTVLTGVLILAALAVAAILSVLSSIASAAEILPGRAVAGDAAGPHASRSTHRAQNLMPTRIGMKSQ
jgi:hypothetical protein